MSIFGPDFGFHYLVWSSLSRAHYPVFPVPVPPFLLLRSHSGPIFRSHPGTVCSVLSAPIPVSGPLCPGPTPLSFQFLSHLRSSLSLFHPGPLFRFRSSVPMFPLLRSHSPVYSVPVLYPLCFGSIPVLSVPVPLRSSVPVPYRFHLFRSHTGSLCSGPSVPPASVPPQVLFVPAPPPVQTVCSGPDSRRSLSRSLFLVHFIPIPHAVSVPSPVLSVPFPPPVLSAPVPLSKSLCPPSRYPVFSVRILLPGPLYPTPILSVLVPFTGPICPSPTPTMLSFPQWSEKYWSCQVLSNKPLPDDTRARSWVESGRCSLPVLRHAELVQTTADMVRICLSVHSFQC